MPRAKLLPGGVLRVRVTDGLTLNAGAWHMAADHHHRPTAIIEPPALPMLQQVVEYLETKPVPPGGNMRRADEARAAVAWWLALCGSDDRRYWDLVHRALAYLPTGPKTVRPLPLGDGLLACATPEMAAQVRRDWPADRLGRDLDTAKNHGMRLLANAITLHAWRNGPVEDVHAGWAEGFSLDERRVLPQAEKAIIRQAQSGLYTGLKAVDYLRYGGAWPPPAERVLPFMHPLIAPSRWSLTDMSLRVELPLPRDEQISA